MNLKDSAHYNQLLASIVNSSTDSIIGTDVEGIILSWNNGATELYQYHPDEIIGKPIMMLYPSEVHAEMVIVHQKVLQGIRVERLETKRITKDGHVLNITVSFSPILNEKGTVIGVSTISSNITEKIKNEADIHRLNSINQAILDSSFYMIISVDTKGIIQTFNKAAEQLTGYQARDVIGKTTPMIFHDLDEVEKRSKELSRELGRPVAGFDVFVEKANLGEFEENEWTYIRKDGSRFPVLLIPTAIRDTDNNITGYFGILRDVSDRRRLQLALEQNEKRFRTLVDNALDSIITIDDTGIIHSFGKSSENIFKYTSNEMIGGNIRQLIDEKNADFIMSFLAKENANFTGIRREITCLRRNDIPFSAEVSINQMIIDGNPWYIWITRDITDRKKLDQMKQEFISTVSHELRTPLTSIKGALGLIASGKSGEIPPQSQKLLDIALRNSDRLVTLINDILDIEKIETGNLIFNIDEHDLIPLVKSSIENNNPLAEQNDVTLTFHCDYSKLIVVVDPDRLIQVITNLLSNAIKYSPKGEEVTLTITKMHDIIRLSVSDKGPGIPSKFHSRIFQKFAQVDSSDKRQKSGTGLGLNISKSIMEKFGGTIGYNSQEGKGSTFFIELAECKDSFDASRNGKILICEDDPDAASILNSILHSSNISTVISYTAENAKEKLTNEKFTAMLLDIALPGQDGLSLLKELRESLFADPLPIIVVSAKDMPKEAIMDNKSFPIIEWLKKPIDAQKLTKVLEKFKNHFSNHKKKILHVEDDVDLCRIVAIVLEDLVDIDFAHTVSEAKEKIVKDNYNLILLDLNLPDGSGLSILRDLPQLSNTPVIIFAAADIQDALEDTGQVRTTLIKSKTTNEKLRREIKNLIDADSESIQQEKHPHEH